MLSQFTGIVELKLDLGGRFLEPGDIAFVLERVSELPGLLQLTLNLEGDYTMDESDFNALTGVLMRQRLKAVHLSLQDRVLAECFGGGSQEVSHGTRRRVLEETVNRSAGLGQRLLRIHETFYAEFCE